MMNHIATTLAITILGITTIKSVTLGMMTIKRQTLRITIKKQLSAHHYAVSIMLRLGESKMRKL